MLKKYMSVLRCFEELILKPQAINVCEALSCVKLTKASIVFELNISGDFNFKSFAKANISRID